MESATRELKTELRNLNGFRNATIILSNGQTTQIDIHKILQSGIILTDLMFPETRAYIRWEFIHTLIWR